MTVRLPLIVAVLACTLSCSPAPAVAEPTAPPGLPYLSTASVPEGKSAITALERLPIRVPDTGAHYDRAAWGGWTTVAGCDTRERVLIRDATTPPSRGARCTLSGGVWVSPYDGVRVVGPAGMQADHLVPLKEANVSGARGWDATRRHAFYNDPANLRAVSARANGAKSDSDPARYRPPAYGYQCRYATDYVAVKAGYGLSVDQAEHDALASMLRACRA